MEPAEILVKGVMVELAGTNHHPYVHAMLHNL
jgi:hypothetical protein